MTATAVNTWTVLHAAAVAAPEQYQLIPERAFISHHEPAAPPAWCSCASGGGRVSAGRVIFLQKRLRVGGMTSDAVITLATGAGVSRALDIAALVLAVAVAFEPGLAPGWHYAGTGGMGGM